MARHSTTSLNTIRPKGKVGGNEPEESRSLIGSLIYAALCTVSNKVYSMKTQAKNIGMQQKECYDT